MEVKLQYIQVSVRKGPKVPPGSVSMSFVLLGWQLASRIHISKFRGVCTAQMNVALSFPCPRNNRASIPSTSHIRDQLLMLVGGSCLPQDSRCTEETEQEAKGRKVADIIWKKVSEGVEV
jgi:hypothetical protein